MFSPFPPSELTCVSETPEYGPIPACSLGVRVTPIRHYFGTAPLLASVAIPRPISHIVFVMSFCMSVLCVYVKYTVVERPEIPAFSQHSEDQKLHSRGEIRMVIRFQPKSEMSKHEGPLNSTRGGGLADGRIRL